MVSFNGKAIDYSRLNNQKSISLFLNISEEDCKKLILDFTECSKYTITYIIHNVYNLDLTFDSIIKLKISWSE